MLRPSRRAADPAPDAVALTDVRLDATTTPGTPGVNLILPSGSFHFLTGPAGAGKSRLLDVVGLRRPARAGRLRLFGQDATAPSRGALASLRRRIGHAGDGGALPDHLDLFETVALPLRLFGAPRGESDRHVDELLAWTGLKPHARLRPSQVSASERRLAALARAVVARPELLLVDQEAYGERTLALISSMHRNGVAVVMTGRDPILAETMGARPIRLDAGRVVEPVA